MPLLLAFVSDLMFTTRIAKVAEHLNFGVEWIETADELGAADPGEMRERPGEVLHGRDGRLFERVTRTQPALLLFDLNNAAIPWQQWIPALKSSAATRRIPIMCFGPHEDVATMTAARDAGADAVLARSRFTADMPALFQRYARLPDTAALATACAEPLLEPIHAAIALFNAGRYYECHDALEEAWRRDQRPGRELYQGLLQVGIAYYQIERGNTRGALKMLLRARQWLDPLPAICRGLDVAALRADAARVYDALTAVGPEGLSTFDRSLFRPIRFVTVQ